MKLTERQKRRCHYTDTFGTRQTYLAGYVEVDMPAQEFVRLLDKAAEAYRFWAESARFWAARSKKQDNRYPREDYVRRAQDNLLAIRRRRRALRYALNLTRANPHA